MAIMGKPRATPPQKSAPPKARRLPPSARVQRLTSIPLGKVVVLAALALGVTTMVANLLRSPVTDPATARMPRSILNAEDDIGARAFARHCQVCHGSDGGGTRAGPPLIHKIYEPAHHSDRSFVRAVRHGVVAHHWRFGDMPRLPDVTDQELDAIIRFVRAMQRANGIH